jgi:hypothetical protein
MSAPGDRTVRLVACAVAAACLLQLAWLVCDGVIIRELIMQGLLPLLVVVPAAVASAMLYWAAGRFLRPLRRSGALFALAAAGHLLSAWMLGLRYSFSDPFLAGAGIGVVGWLLSRDALERDAGFVPSRPWPLYVFLFFFVFAFGCDVVAGYRVLAWLHVEPGIAALLCLVLGGGQAGVVWLAWRGWGWVRLPLAAFLATGLGASYYLAGREGWPAPFSSLNSAPAVLEYAGIALLYLQSSRDWFAGVKAARESSRRPEVRA